MAFDTWAQLSGYSSNGVRRMDHLDASVCQESKRIPGRHRLRVHGTVRKSRYHLHTIRDFAVLAVISVSGSAAGTTLITRGHW
jgi:hypothetical protein